MWDASELRNYTEGEPIVALGALVLSIHVQYMDLPLELMRHLAPPLKEDVMTRTVIPALLSSTAINPVLAYLVHTIYSTNSTTSNFPDSTISTLVHVSITVL